MAALRQANTHVDSLSPSRPELGIQRTAPLAIPNPLSSPSSFSSSSDRQFLLDYIFACEQKLAQYQQTYPQELLPPPSSSSSPSLSNVSDISQFSCLFRSYERALFDADAHEKQRKRQVEMMREKVEKAQADRNAVYERLSSELSVLSRTCDSLAAARRDAGEQRRMEEHEAKLRAQQCEALSEAVAMLKAQLSSEEQRADAAERRLSIMSIECGPSSSALQRVRAMAAQQERTAAQLKESEGRLQELRARLADSVSKCGSAESANVRLLGDLDRAIDAASQSNKKGDKLYRQLSEAQVIENSLNERIAVLEVENKRLSERYVSIRAHADSLELAAVQAKASRCTHNHDSELMAMRNRESALVAELAAIRVAHIELEGDLARTARQLEDAQQSADKQQKHFEQQIAAAVEEGAARTIEAQQQQAELITATAAARRSELSAHQKAREAECELERFKARYQETATHRDELAIVMRAQAERTREIEAQRADDKARHDDVRAALECALKATGERLAALEERNKTDKEEERAAFDGLIAQLAERSRQCEEMRESFVCQIERLRAAAAAERAAYDERINGLELSLVAAANQRASLDSRCSALVRERDQAMRFQQEYELFKCAHDSAQRQQRRAIESLTARIKLMQAEQSGAQERRADDGRLINMLRIEGADKQKRLDKLSGSARSRHEAA